MNLLLLPAFQRCYLELLSQQLLCLHACQLKVYIHYSKHILCVL